MIVTLAFEKVMSRDTREACISTIEAIRNDHKRVSDLFEQFRTGKFLQACSQEFLNDH